MKIGLIADIHCHIDGLRWALSKLENVDQIFCAGDALTQFRFSDEVIELLRFRGVLTIQGNHEHVLLSPQGERAFASAKRPENQRFVQEMPIYLDTKVDGKRLYVVHGSPWAPFREYMTPANPHYLELPDLGADFVIVGHSHAPLVSRVGRTTLVNPGSCGEPRSGLEWTCAIIDLSTDTIEIYNRSLNGPDEDFINLFVDF